MVDGGRHPAHGILRNGALVSEVDDSGNAAHAGVSTSCAGAPATRGRRGRRPVRGAASRIQLESPWACLEQDIRQRTIESRVVDVGNLPSSFALISIEADAIGIK